MDSFWLKIIGGFILLASWLCREMWGRRQEQLASEYRRNLDAKARAEDACLVVATQRRIFDSIVYMQSVVGFLDDSIGKPPGPQRQKYTASAQELQNALDNSRKAYAVKRLSHIWAIVKERQATAEEENEWTSMEEVKVLKLGDELEQQVEIVGARLGKNTRWADRIVAVMYIFGTLFVLASS